MITFFSMRNFSTASSGSIATTSAHLSTRLGVKWSHPRRRYRSVKRAMPSGVNTEARRSFLANQKQMFLIVGHLAKPLSDAAFASAAARSC
jgi:hypothetical protein